MMLSTVSRSSTTRSSTASSVSSRATDHALSFSSRSSNSVFNNATVDTDEAGFTLSQHRAGGPYLCSLPAVTGEIGKTYPYHRVLLQHRLTLENTIARMLRNKKVDFKDVRIVGRQSKVDMEPSPMPTVLVVANRPAQFNQWVDDWRSVAKDLHTLVNLVFPGISIDIIEEALNKPFFYHPVRHTDTMFRKWDKIRMVILEELEISDWTGLECWRFGTSDDPLENPVTVIASIQKHSSKEHHDDCQKVMDILLQFGEHSVETLFMRDEHTLYQSRNPQLEEEDCTQHAQPGISIGIHNSSAGSSTLGGLVDLRFPGSQEWRRYGLTCFHAVYPPEGHRDTLNMTAGADQALALWKWHPIKMDDQMAQKLLHVDHPSVGDLRSAISRAESTKKEALDRDYCDLKFRMRKHKKLPDVYVTDKEQSRFKTKNLYIQAFRKRHKFFQSFLDKRQYYLGHVVAGSGLYRTKQQAHMKTGNVPSALDWALINIDPQRLGENKPAHAKSQDLILPIKFQDADEPDPEYSGPLWKSARSMGFTRGDYNCLIQAKITKELNQKGEIVTKVTHEHMISSSHGVFGEPGDSGAFVFDKYGGVIGMVLGGFERKDTIYFAHIDNIFDDIKRVTGAEDVRIAV